MIIFDKTHIFLSLFFQSFVLAEFSFYAVVNLGHKVRVILWIVLFDLNLGKQLSVIPPRDPAYAIKLFEYHICKMYDYFVSSFSCC